MTYIPATSIDQTTPGTTDSVTLKAGELHLGEIGSNSKVSGVELTRPADAASYILNDVVSNSTSAPTNLVFSNIARINGGSGYIVKAVIHTDQKANVANFRLHLFNIDPTPINDNAAFRLLYVNKASWIGSIDFSSFGTEDATASTSANTFWTGQLFYKANSGSQTIYGILETKTGFTPASGQKFYIELSVDNN